MLRNFTIILAFSLILVGCDLFGSDGDDGPSGDQQLTVNVQNLSDLPTHPNSGAFLRVWRPTSSFNNVQNLNVEGGSQTVTLNVPENDGYQVGVIAYFDAENAGLVPIGHSSTESTFFVGPEVDNTVNLPLTVADTLVEVTDPSSLSDGENGYIGVRYGFSAPDFGQNLTAVEGDSTNFLFASGSALTPTSDNEVVNGTLERTFSVEGDGNTVYYKVAMVSSNFNDWTPGNKEFTPNHFPSYSGRSFTIPSASNTSNKTNATSTTVITVEDLIRSTRNN